MQITLSYPFNTYWSKAYLRKNREGRNVIDLYKNDKERKTISYARYLLSVKLGHEIPSGYEVDHIDNDKTNDDMNNLQAISSQENKLKQQWNYVLNIQNVFGCSCANCGINFLITERDLNAKLAQNVELAFCSKSCSAKYNYQLTKMRNSVNG